MSRWPEYWPSAVREHYEGLAARYAWPPPTVEAVVADVEHLRLLDGSARVRRHFRAHLHGTTWFWEAVEEGGELVAVRQVERDADGIRRYWWGCREDDEGFLPEQPLDPVEDALDPIPAGEFHHVWDDPAVGT